MDKIISTSRISAKYFAYSLALGGLATVAYYVQKKYFNNNNKFDELIKEELEQQ